MMRPRLILVTGLPGTGKTTLARELARRLRVPAIGKDMIKEPLLDVLGSGCPARGDPARGDPARSRQLSDASFAVLFRLAGELLAVGAVLVLEGNFRAGEHEAPLLAALPAGCNRSQSGAPLVQVMCRVEESLRLERLRQRAQDPARHAGHRDDTLVSAPTRGGGSFLDLPGRRLEFDSSGSPPCYDELAARL